MSKTEAAQLSFGLTDVVYPRAWTTSEWHQPGRGQRVSVRGRTFDTPYVKLPFALKDLSTKLKQDIVVVPLVRKAGHGGNDHHVWVLRSAQ
jgi:hypothetical protein